jgi:hypothetical protein
MSIMKNLTPDPPVAPEREAASGPTRYERPRLEKLGDIRSAVLGTSPNGAESGSLVSHRPL